MLNGIAPRVGADGIVAGGEVNANAVVVGSLRCCTGIELTFHSNRFQAHPVIGNGIQ